MLQGWAACLHSLCLQECGGITGSRSQISLPLGVEDRCQMGQSLPWACGGLVTAMVAHCTGGTEGPLCSLCFVLTGLNSLWLRAKASTGSAAVPGGQLVL